MQHARAVYFAAGYHVGGPGQRLHRQQGKGRGRSEQLGVRGRGKQPAFVQSIQRLPVQRRHADAKPRMAQRRLGQNGLDAVSQRSLCRCGMRSGM